MANQNIPGVSFHYKDEGRLVPVPTGPLTDTVLIVGHAVDGPVNIPIMVNSKNVEQVFGPIVYDNTYVSSDAAAGTDPNYGRYNGNSLVKAYAEVVQGGCTSVILMRVGDAAGTVCKQATVESATLTGDTYTAGGTEPDLEDELLGINLKAKYPGSVYNGIGMTVTYTVTAGSPNAVTGDGWLEIHQEIKKKGRTLKYKIVSGGVALTKRQLIEKINADPRNNSIAASAVADETNLDADILLPTTTAGSKTHHYILGGSSGTKGKDGVKADYTELKDVYYSLMGWLLDTDVTDDPRNDARTAGEAYEESPFAQFETLEADIVYMAALYADDNIGDETTPASIMLELGKAVHTAAKNDYPMVSVIGSQPYTESIPVKVSDVVENLTLDHSDDATDGVTTSGRLKLGWFVSLDEATKVTTLDWLDPDLNDYIDLGRYILLVAGPDVVLNHPKIGTYVETGAGVYAGLISTLPPYRAVTNMQLPGVRSLAYTFTNRQLNKVAGGQPFDDDTQASGLGGSYVCFRRNINGNIVVNLDNSAAARDSDYASYQVMYIVNMAASGLKRVVEPFIGMSAHTTTKTAMENQVRKFLDYLAESRAIAGGEGVGYEFAITASGVDQLLGRINIELTLRPALQIKTVNITVSVAPPTGA